MPNPKEQHVLVKSIPGHVAWGNQILYTFPWRDEQRSTEEVNAYRLPYSPGTFWVNFRVSRFQENGILRTDGVRLRLVVRTVAGDSITIVPWKVYYPPSWYSMRWPLPSLPYAEGVGIWLEMEHQASSRNQIEIQGFDGAYPMADRYIVVDEEDRHVLLFQQERDVRVGQGSVGKEKVASIHDLFDEDLPATHGVSPTEVDGVALFPLALRR